MRDAGHWDYKGIMGVIAGIGAKPYRTVSGLAVQR